MSHPQHPPIRVAFLGFSDFERTALATFFRLAAEREPMVELVYTLTDADFLVAEADHAPSVQLVVVTERMAETVFIGSRAPEGAASSMRRPIDALHVMRALDELARLNGRVAATAPPAATVLVAATVPAPSPAARADVIVQSMLHLPAPAVQAAPQLPRGGSSRAVPSVPLRRVQLPTAALGNAPPADFVGPPPPARALLVDDSAIALRFLASRLVPWSLRTDAVSTSGEALRLLGQRSYEFIFLDLELGADSEMDGLALCRHIKRSELAVNAAVVLVSAHNSEIDRARGSLAGCDGYLGKPLKDNELFMLLQRQGLLPPAGAPVRAPTSAGAWPAARA